MNESDLLIDTIAALTKELFRRYPEQGGSALVANETIIEMQRQAFMDGALWFGQYAKEEAELLKRQNESYDAVEKVGKSLWMQRMEEMQRKQNDLNKPNE